MHDKHDNVLHMENEHNNVENMHDVHYNSVTHSEPTR